MLLLLPAPEDGSETAMVAAVAAELSKLLLLLGRRRLPCLRVAVVVSLLRLVIALLDVNWRMSWFWFGLTPSELFGKGELTAGVGGGGVDASQFLTRRRSPMFVVFV